MTTATLIVGYLGGVVLIGLLACLAVAWHMAYTQLDVMLEHLQNSSGVTAFASFRHGGPRGKLMVLGKISGLVTFPGFYAWSHEISSEDLTTFPKHLKRKLAILQWAIMGLSVAMLLVAALGKLMKVYHI